MASQQQFEKWEKEYLGEEWPAAVPPSMIVTDEQQKWIRARSICNYYLPDINGLRVLDFGCGAGHVAVAASQQAKRSVGYDIVDKFVESYDFDYDKTKFVLTTDWKEVAKIQKFDVVLLYDVLDHIQPNRVEAAFRTIASVCSPNTKVHVRCHPWTSPHGGHVYENVNKAFAHFFMDEARLQKHQNEYVNPIIRPMHTYRSWFKEYGFKEVEMSKIQYPWDTDKNAELFKGDRQQRMDELKMGDPKWQCSVFQMEFVDFVLQIK